VRSPLARRAGIGWLAALAVGGGGASAAAVAAVARRVCDAAIGRSIDSVIEVELLSWKHQLVAEVARTSVRFRLELAAELAVVVVVLRDACHGVPWCGCSTRSRLAEMQDARTVVRAYVFRAQL